MEDNNKITFSLDKTDKDKEFELRESETNKALRETLKSIKRSEWIKTDYELALEMLESDFLRIGDALSKFYWESSRTRVDAEKTLNIVRDVIENEVLMEKLSEKPEG